MPSFAYGFGAHLDLGHYSHHLGGLKADRSPVTLGLDSYSQSPQGLRYISAGEVEVPGCDEGEHLEANNYIPYF